MRQDAVLKETEPDLTEEVEELLATLHERLVSPMYAELFARSPDLLHRLVETVKRLRAEAVSLREREGKQLGTVIEIRGCDKCDLCEDHQ